MNRKEGDSLAKILILLLPILLLGVFFVSALTFDNNYPSLSQIQSMKSSSWDNLQSFDRVESIWYPDYTRLVPYSRDENGYINFLNNLNANLVGSPFEPSSNDCPSIFPAPFWIAREGTCLPKDGGYTNLQTCQELGTYGYDEETCQGEQDDPQSWDCQTTWHPGGEDTCVNYSSGLCYWNDYVCGKCEYDSDCLTGNFCNMTTGLCQPNTGSCNVAQYCVGLDGCYNFNEANGLTTDTAVQNCLNYDPGYQTEVPACSIYTTCGKSFGEICSSNSECTSGYCRNILNATTGFSSEKRCADNATNCVFKKTTSPTSSVTYRAMSNEIHCTPSASSPFVYRCENGVWDQLDQEYLLAIHDPSNVACIYGCNTENIWLNPDGTTRSINNAVTPLTYVCVEEQSFKWADVDMGFFETSSPVNPLEIADQAVVNLVVQNPVNTGGTFSLYEIDYPDEWTVSNFNLNDDLNSYLSAPQTVLVNGVNMTYTTFTFSQDLINAISETEEGSVFEFKFEYDYDTGVNESVILYVLRSMDTCSNGILDGDENGVDCGGSCPTVCGCNFNGVCESANNENHITCPCDCVPAGTKLLNWTFTYLEFSANAGDSLSVGMRIYNPDSEDSTINLYEEDNLGDDLIKENVEGAYVVLGCGLPYISYSSSIATEDYLTASESDGSYEFYFTDGSGDSPILTINLIGEIPQCGDGSCQSSSGEDELTCPSDCGACTEEFLVCGDYGNEGSCVSDNCDVSKSHGGECYWNTISSGCEERTTFTVGGVNIGSCLYSDDTSADDCSDSFLTYSWNAEWFWDPTNTEHYDPENMQASCVSGEATIPCPAQVQLSYFTWKNLVVAITLILVIYILIKLRQKGKKIRKEAMKKSNKKVVKKSSKKVLKKKVSKKRK